MAFLLNLLEDEDHLIKLIYGIITVFSLYLKMEKI